MSHHHDAGERERIAWAAALLRDLWGDALPPGPVPWQRVVTDLLEMDDDFGARRGVIVQGDEIPLSLLGAVLSYVPADASLRGLLSESLTRRVTSLEQYSPTGEDRA